MMATNSAGAERRRSRRQLTLVAAGHAGSVLKELSAEEPTGVILKVVDQTELDFYKVICKTNEGIKKFIPEFGGETTLDGEKFLRLENVASPFRHPYVMDCKIGTRTFVEKEAKVTKPRPDLFKRAFAHYASHLTEEEKKNEFITKYRWMSIHDECSSTKNLGYRIDGVAGKRKVEKAMLNKLRTQEDVVNHFVNEFIPRVVEGSFRPESTRRQIGALLSRKMRELRRMFEESPTMQRHEVIGCSLLFVADCDGRCGISMIDFAKTKKVPDDINIDHRTPWVLGNHEDGILFGIDNLVSVFDEVLARTKYVPNEQEEVPYGWMQSLLCVPFANQGEDEIVVHPIEDAKEEEAEIEEDKNPVEESLGIKKPARNTIGVPVDGFNAEKQAKITIVGKGRNMRSTLARGKPSPTHKAGNALTQPKTQDDAPSSSMSFPNQGRTMLSAPAELLLDSGSSMPSNIASMPSNIASMPSNIIIEPSESRQFGPSSGDFRVTQDIAPGHDGHLVVDNRQTEEYGEIRRSAISGVTTSTRHLPKEEDEHEQLEKEMRGEEEVRPPTSSERMSRITR